MDFKPKRIGLAILAGLIAVLCIRNPETRRKVLRVLLILGGIVVGSIFLALLLLGLIAYGVQKLRPVMEEARKLNAAPKLDDPATAPTPPSTDGNGTANTGTNPSGTDAAANPNASKSGAPAMVHP